MIDRQTIERIVDAADIVDVVSEFVTLRRSGANYKGLCPFHNEKTPSFVVSPARGYCHCFSCGKGGNAVGFIMEHEQMTYPEALRWLARRYGIEVRERELSDEEKREQGDRESMFILNEWALGRFQSNLRETEEGRAVGMGYFRSRGFRDDAIARFGLGYAPRERDGLARAALAAGYKERYLVDTGLCLRREDGTLLDRYWDRVIFPIHTPTGRVVAFAGRIMGQDRKLAKYVNSPESLIYHKGGELYGLYQAKQAISRNDRCFLVEGYTDVISMHQSGVENVVASSGTSLTQGQVRLIGRFTRNITVLYDGDAAGIKASIRGIDMLLSEGMNVKVLLLPDGDDPDSFSRKHAPAEFREYIDAHQVDFIEFKAGLLLDGERDPVKRSEAINGILRSVSVIRDQIVRATYIKECSRLCALPEATLISTVNRLIRADIEARDRERARAAAGDGPGARPAGEPARGAIPAPAPKAREMDAEALEYMLMEDIVRHGEKVLFHGVEDADGNVRDVSLAEFVARNLEEDGLGLENATFARMLSEVVLHLGDEGFTSEGYLVHHPDLEISSLATRLAIEPYHVSRSLRVAADAETLATDVRRNLLAIRKEYLQRKLRELLGEMDRALAGSGDTEDMRRRLDRINDLRRRISGETGHVVKL